MLPATSNKIENKAKTLILSPFQPRFSYEFILRKAFSLSSLALSLIECGGLFFCGIYIIRFENKINTIKNKPYFYHYYDLFTLLSSTMIQNRKNLFNRKRAKRLPIRKAAALQRSTREAAALQRSTKEIVKSESESEYSSDSEYLPSSESEEEEDNDEEQEEEEQEEEEKEKEGKDKLEAGTSYFDTFGLRDYLGSTTGGKMVQNI